ncbi:MAG: hypothetical protein JKY69_03675, partial [Flavobacteriaceae bacterium]|nr:hypothetical protein [Flavobacteriaceae bacterium]
MRILVSFLLLFISTLSFGQKEANIWYFGENAVLDFNTGTAVPKSTDSKLTTREGCSSFADADGNLLFYSDGKTIWGKDDEPMNFSNGSSTAGQLLGSSSSTQSAMIIPKPGSTTIYYLFTVGSNLGSDIRGFNFYTIDISKNGGLGEVIEGPINLENNETSGSWTEKVAAVRGRDCNTFWVVSLVSNKFYAYEVSSTGVSSSPEISVVDHNVLTGINQGRVRGYLKISPNGKWLAVAHQNDPTTALLYSFDDNFGKVSNDGISLINSNLGEGSAYGVEFSRSSNKLYITTSVGTSSNKLFQFDLEDVNSIVNSKVLIKEQINSFNETSGPGTIYRSGMQLGPDGKIYVSTSQSYQQSTKFLDVINKPDLKGLQCDFVIDAIDIAVNADGLGPLASQGLPPFISSLLLPIEIKDNDTGQVINNQDLQYCNGENKNISPDPVAGINPVYTWTFNDGTTTTTIADTRELSLTNLSAANSGSYTLTVQLTDDCGVITELEGIFNIEVYPAPLATKPADTNFCDTYNDGFNIFDFSATKTTTILDGQDSDIFEVIYYTSLADANANTNAISDTNYENPTAFSNQIIYSRVHNILAPNACFVLTDFVLSVTG